MMQYNYRSRFLVVINEITCVSVYKYEKNKFDQPLLSFQAKFFFVGKSRVCQMREFSGAMDNSTFNGNTILLEVEDKKNVYISGLEIFEFRTDDKILDYISLLGKNMIPHTFAIGEKNIYFISAHYKFLENHKIEERMLLNASNNCLDPHDYHFSKKRLDCFKNLLDCNRIHSCWLSLQSGDKEEIVENEEDVEEDVNIQELEYTDGSNEVVKFLNQKCVIRLERDSDYLFKQCGHQSICEECYQIKANLGKLKCVICRT